MFPNKDIYDSPDKLIKEFYDIEQENLFLIMESEDFKTQMANSLNEPSKLLEDAERAFKHVSEVLEKRQNTLFAEAAKKPEPIKVDTSSVDKEINTLAEYVSKTYDACFNTKADLSPIAMLEKIENTLESFYKKIEWVAPHFVYTMQAKFDRERREALRLAAQREKELQQQEKKDQAVERARKPIMKKFGRPLVERSLPFRFKRQKDTRKDKLLAEQKANEELLFGD